MNKTTSTENTVLSLTAEERQPRGTRAAQRIRAQGRIPAIVYGRTKALPISIDAKEFAHLFTHVSENVLIDLTLPRGTRHVIVKDYSTNVLTGEMVHLDFLEVRKGKMLRTHTPVVPVGISTGVRSGGVFEQPAHEIEIECIPQNLPQKIEMDITDLQVGDSFHVSDLLLPQGVTVLSNPEMVLCHVAAVRITPTEEDVAEPDSEDIDSTEE